HSICPMEEHSGLSNGSLKECFSDPATGDRFVLPHNRGHNSSSHANLLAEPGQDIDVSATSPSEAEVGTFDNRPGCKPLLNDAPEKVFGRELEQFGRSP